VIVEEAHRIDAEVVLLSTARKQRVGERASVFGRTVGYVLQHASCRVLLLTPPPAR
jgi:nucleotide-binding universal stress UspA family protein